MKKVFIDCGANQGQTIENFKEHWKDWDQFEIHSFEANSALFSHFRKYEKEPNIHFHPKAVWIEEGSVDFYIGTHDGSSTRKDKKTGSLSKKPVSVPAIDLASWIKSTFAIDDYVILKVDIEGGEYDLIPHLLATDTFKYVDKFYIEFHNWKVDVDVERDAELIQQISDQGTEVISDTWVGFNFIGR